MTTAQRLAGALCRNVGRQQLQAAATPGDHGGLVMSSSLACTRRCDISLFVRLQLRFSRKPMVAAVVNDWIFVAPVGLIVDCGFDSSRWTHHRKHRPFLNGAKTSRKSVAYAHGHYILLY